VISSISEKDDIENMRIISILVLNIAFAFMTVLLSSCHDENLNSDPSVPTTVNVVDSADMMKVFPDSTVKNAENVLIKYDGVNSYGEIHHLNGKYFADVESYSDNIVKIMISFGVVVNDSKGYAAVKYYNHPYLKENLLYSCTPDGKPYEYDVNDDLRIGNGFVFYAEVKDGFDVSEVIDCFQVAPTEMIYVSIASK
jgi:hypothetical protein